MNEENSTSHQFETIDKRGNRLNNFISTDEKQILEEVNSIFLRQIIKELSILVNSDVKLIAYNMTIGFDDANKNIIKPLMYFNTLEILPCKNEFYVIFSPNMLFLMIDIFFGGKSRYINYINNKLEITSTEYFINQKLIQLISKIYSYSWKKFFLIDTKFIHVKKDIGVMQKNLHLNQLLITQHFIFNIHNIEIYFYLFSPLSLLEILNKNKKILSKDDINLHKKNVQTLSMKNIYNISLNIVAQLACVSISNSKIAQISIGDIFIIKNPEKAIICVDKKPVFFGKYNSFDGKSAIFIKELINRKINYNCKNKEDYNEEYAENV